MKIFIQKKYNFFKSLIQKSKLFFKRIFEDSDFFHNKIILWLIILNFLINLINWIILATLIDRVDGGIILHYNVYFGVDSIGDTKQAFLMPAIGSILFILNSTLAGYFYKKKERIASYILLLSSLMAQLSLIIASISVIIINY